MLIRTLDMYVQGKPQAYFPTFFNVDFTPQMYEPVHTWPSFFIAFRFSNVKPTQNITMYHIVINKSLFLQQKLFRENTVILVL